MKRAREVSKEKQEEKQAKEEMKAESKKKTKKNTMFYTSFCRIHLLITLISNKRNRYTDAPAAIVYCTVWRTACLREDVED
jgi:hypothetical protein